MQAALTELAAKRGSVRDVHDVRVRETADGEIVNFHCYVDPALTVADVHEQVDDLERALKLALPVDQARDRPRRAALTLTANSAHCVSSLDVGIANVGDGERAP